MAEIERKKIAHQGQMVLTAFERQGRQTTSRGHSNTGTEWPWMAFTVTRHGRKNTCATQQLSVLVTLTAQHKRGLSFICFSPSLRGMQRTHIESHSTQRESEGSKKRPCHDHCLCSPSLKTQRVTALQYGGQMWKHSEMRRICCQHIHHNLFVLCSEAPGMYSLIRNMHT